MVFVITMANMLLQFTQCSDIGPTNPQIPLNETVNPQNNWNFFDNAPRNNTQISNDFLMAISVILVIALNYYCSVQIGDTFCDNTSNVIITYY